MSEVFAVQHKTRRCRFSRGGFNLVLAALLQRPTERACWSLFAGFFFGCFSLCKKMKPGWGERARHTQLIFNNLATLSVFPPSSRRFFVFMLTTVAPVWHFFFFAFYFIFVVAASRCWATASLHLEEESPAAIYCVCRRDWRFCSSLSAVFCGWGTWIRVDRLWCVYWGLSTGSKGIYLRIKGFCIWLSNVLLCACVFFCR